MERLDGPNGPGAWPTLTEQRELFVALRSNWLRPYRDRRASAVSLSQADVPKKTMTRAPYVPLQVDPKIAKALWIKWLQPDVVEPPIDPLAAALRLELAQPTSDDVPAHLQRIAGRRSLELGYPVVFRLRTSAPGL